MESKDKQPLTAGEEYLIKLGYSEFVKPPSQKEFSPSFQWSTVAGIITPLITALNKINDVRNSIVGYQKIDWSAHIYPLVAALQEAGIKGDGYEEARKLAKTQIERIKTLEEEKAHLQKEHDAYREKYICNQHTVVNQQGTIGNLKADLEVSESSANKLAEALEKEKKLHEETEVFSRAQSLEIRQLKKQLNEK